MARTYISSEPSSEYCTPVTMSDQRGSLRTLAVLCLLVVVQSHDFDYANPAQLAGFINRLGETMQMSGLGIVYRQSSEQARHLNEFIKALHCEESGYFGRRPMLIANEQQNGMQWERFFDANTMVLTFAEHIHDSILSVTSMITHRQRYSFAIFIVDRVQSSAGLKALFEFLWKHQFLRALVVADRRGLYNMMPYPEISVVDVSGASMQSYFPPRRYEDLRGYKLPVPVQIDIPFTFWYRDLKDGSVVLDGIGGRMFGALMQHINVTLLPYPLTVNGSQDLDIEDITQMILDGRVEVSPHLVPTFRRAAIDYSYPQSLTRRCLALPLLNEIPPHLYLVLPYTLPVWLAIVGLLLFASVAARLWTRCTRPPKALRSLTSIGGIELTAVCVLLAVPAPFMRNFHGGHLSMGTFVRLLLIYTAVFIGGFYISQCYSTMLHSYMTVTPYAEASTTLESAWRTGRPIMLPLKDRDLFLAQAVLSEKFSSRIVYADDQEVQDKRLSMDMDYIVPMNEHRWRIAELQQRFLLHKRFYLSSLCFGSFAVQFQMRENSHFRIPLLYYMMKFRENGLYNYWEAASFEQARRLGFIDYIREDEHSAQKTQISHGLSFSILAPVGYLYAGGMLLSTFVFLIELHYASLKKLWSACKRK